MDKIAGPLAQMSNALDANFLAQYHLPIGEQAIALNPLVGKPISLAFSGQMACVGCGRVIQKSFQQGYCFPCTQRLAACDLCIVKPELCHFDKGTCREPEWGKAHCMQPHYVYLANSSGLKVGITRAVNVPYRWIDQGATQGLLLAKMHSRYFAGLLEVQVAQHIADKTNWRKMLQGEAEPVDLQEVRAQLLPKLTLDPKQGGWLLDATPYQIKYPVLQYPQKLVSLGFDKTAEISGVLHGIKGQYLLLDSGVLNVRKFAGYQIKFESTQ